MLELNNLTSSQERRIKIMQTFTIDQTAELIMRFTYNNAPCEYAEVANNIDGNWCSENCECRGEDVKSLRAVKKCWVNAFKKGWIK